MASRWIQAATILQPTIEVCGTRLLPFCLRHRVALEAINSPVVREGERMTPKHLIAAVRILSSKSLDEIRRPNSFKEQFWVSRLTFSNKRLVEETAKLWVYMEAQSFWPRFWVKNESARTGGLHWALAVVANLTRNGCTLEESWTMPESEAIWLHVANTMSSGAKVEVVSDEEWAAMEAYKQQMAAEQTNGCKPGEAENHTDRN